MDGIIVIDKSGGLSSHQVIQTVRRIFPGCKVGHSGTLDPMATGVLPVCLGKATRVAEYIVELPKVYRASITLGVTTDTEDATGSILKERKVPSLSAEDIAMLISSFKGEIEQTPPLYSAVKHKGKPLYYWTRRGEEAPRRKRKAMIYWLALLAFNPAQSPHLVIDVHCSKGTYIRTLAADLGEKIGCGAHLAALTRTAVGPYHITDALTTDQLMDLADQNRAAEAVKTIDSALPSLPALFLNDSDLQALSQGRRVKMWPADPKTSLKDHGVYRVYNQDKFFKAIASCQAGDHGYELKTVKYLASQDD